jgi:Carboxypeptidase regulatory-like domain
MFINDDSSRAAGSIFISVPQRFAWLGLIVLICSFSTPAQTEQPPARFAVDAPEAQEKLPGSITGSVVGPDGIAVVGAKVKLNQEGQSVSREVMSSEDGIFTFTDVAPGLFQLVITSEGFSTHASTGTLQSGENFTVPQVSMVLATNATEVRVEVSTAEVAEEQLKDEVKQRVVGVIPNFYVTYAPNAAPLTPKQKYKLAWKLNIDPVSFLMVGQSAGIQQAQNQYSGFGQGAQGYAKRFGATYANFTISNFLGSAMLPSVFKQDPRYFYKGTGTTKSRVLYALANAVICKSDSGHWQVNYSGIMGSLASGGISNLLYPASDRNGPAAIFENTAISIGSTAVFNLMQEFVLRRLTPKVPNTPNPSNSN